MTDELIPGATSSTYVLQPEDVGCTIYCRVTATNPVGTANADSNAVGPITAGAAAPVITTNAAQTNIENTVLAIALTADQSVMWSLVGGSDQIKFGISGTNLQWAGAGAGGTKNFEAPDDANTDNAYIVTVRATATVGGLTTDKTITVTVTDVAEAAGAFTLVASTTASTNAALS